jgi:hypothetical protein
VQAENLPKGDLDRLTLYPETAVERFRRAYVLLAKTLQLVQGLSLSEREVRYLLTHATDFDKLDLSKLPTRAADDQPANAKELFKQFLRLAAYARLKEDLAPGTDDLISVFETKLLSDACKLIATLTRRDENKVEATANQLQLTATDFVNEKGPERLWAAMQLVKKLGVRVESIKGWLTTAPDRFVAHDLKDAVKARYQEQNWQHIAQPIFDRLRQRQRDALAACIMHRRGFERIEQLFEFFLIDAGMEPVVQTSRLRLAISSVQTFIQRCFLNLEPEVDPSALNSSHWQWMKRYRVWEANRKIFLFPENWLEPEFRDDKTHLFQDLEGALLQGDVSNDLAEDAFSNYLNKLEELAQLETVTMYLEEKPDAESNILHLIGRTHNLPRKYFYRRYDHHMWTAWEPVNAEIEGDHVVAVVWRERLHLFWLTFMEKGKLQEGQGNSSIKDGAETPPSKALEKEVEIQLNWSEYFQSEWTTRKSSGFDNPLRGTVPPSFDSSKVFMHLSRGRDSQGVESSLKIVVMGIFAGSNYFGWPYGIYGEFEVLSKNSQPEPSRMDYGWGLMGLIAKPYFDAYQQPYSAGATQPTRFGGSGSLEVTFVNQIETEQGKAPQNVLNTKDILGRGGDFSLLRSSNIADFAAYEASGVFRPFFYQDNQHTFFVEPTVSEKTTTEHEDFGVTPAVSGASAGNLENIANQAQVPLIGNPLPPETLGHFTIQPNGDWLTGATTTTVTLDGHSIGQGGGVGMQLGLSLGEGINLIGRRLGSRSLDH